MKQIRAIRGMNDILPDDSHLWRYLERCCESVLDSYGYREIRMPLVEQTALFSRAIGEVTDIVEKEMYTFSDRNGESLTLRPEGTAGCVRAVTQASLLNTQQKLWYRGPMFRYERPQKGRQRQFHQVGVEVFGVDSADIEAELILLGTRLWRRLGIGDKVSLQLNSLGDLASRDRFRTALVDYLSGHREGLDEDSQRRLASNPLRILDSKSPATQAILEQAPQLPDYLDDASAEHFARLREFLDAAGVSYECNPRLVRGLDYYNRTVFEWVTDDLGAQGTVCAGGRYDGLVEQLGGKSTPAAGFAMGLERLVLMLQNAGSDTASEEHPDVYLCAVGDGVQAAAFRLGERLRDELPGCVLAQHTGGGSFKSQMKKADRSGARLAIILGETEVKQGQAILKDLRVASVEQQSVAEGELAGQIRQRLEGEDI